MTYYNKKYTKQGNHILNEQDCPVCGKTFYPTESWSYKIFVSKTVQYKKVCSYSCTKGKEYKDKQEKAWKDGYNNRWNKESKND